MKRKPSKRKGTFPALQNNMTFTDLRKKAEPVIEDNRLKKTLRDAQKRASLKTEYQRLHGLLFEQLSPHLRERVMREGRGVSDALKDLG